jgi:hypothetical protein
VVEGVVPPLGRNKGKMGSFRGLSALRPILGSGKGRRNSRKRRV